MAQIIVSNDIDAFLRTANDAAARTELGLGDAATKNTGTTAGTVCAGDDARLSNSRTPTAHAATHASGGSDPITLSTAQLSGTVAIANGGTGQNTANAALNALLPSQASQSGKVLSTNGTNAEWVAAGGGGGGVTSFSTGTTGLTPSAASTGAVTLAGILEISNGGTGASSSLNACNNLLPTQNGNPGKFLSTDGTNVSWATPSGSGYTPPQIQVLPLGTSYINIPANAVLLDVWLIGGGGGGAAGVSANGLDNKAWGGGGGAGGSVSRATYRVSDFATIGITQLFFRIGQRGLGGQAGVGSENGENGESSYVSLAGTIVPEDDAFLKAGGGSGGIANNSSGSGGTGGQFTLGNALGTKGGRGACPSLPTENAVNQFNQDSPILSLGATGGGGGGGYDDVSIVYYNGGNGGTLCSASAITIAGYPGIGATTEGDSGANGFGPQIIGFVGAGGGGGAYAKTANAGVGGVGGAGGFPGGGGGGGGGGFTTGGNGGGGADGSGFIVWYF